VSLFSLLKHTLVDGGTPWSTHLALPDDQRIRAAF
jgi:hypothetical protein